MPFTPMAGVFMAMCETSTTMTAMTAYVTHTDFDGDRWYK